MSEQPSGELDAAAHVFVDALLDALTVSGPDGHHLARVRRLAPGEVLTAADGTGRWRRYRVETVMTAGHARLTVAADGASRVAGAPSPALVAAVAALPRSRLDRLVAPLSELGVDRLVVLRTERTQAGIDAARVARLRALARESAMQCRRAVPMLVEGPGELATLAALGSVIVADAGGAGVDAVELPGTPGPSPVALTPAWVVVTGPEGGLTPAERAALAPAPALALGPHVLRAETAAVAAAAVLTQRRSPRRSV